VHDANLHNIALYNSHDCEVTGVEAARSNDKNICVIDVAKVRVIDNNCHDSQVEDGICCHGPVGPYVLVARNRTTGNPRLGIHLGIKSDYAIVAGNVTLSNKVNLCVIGVPPFDKDHNHWKQDNKGLIVIENTVGGKKTGR
jgi:nitrous oxidase accessory protein NosD